MTDPITRRGFFTSAARNTAGAAASAVGAVVDAAKTIMDAAEKTGAASENTAATPDKDKPALSRRDLFRFGRK